MPLQIRSLPLPERCDEPTPVGATFRAAALHAERVGDERLGVGVATLTLAERLAAWQSSDAELHVRRIAVDGDRIVGAVSIWLPMLESTGVAEHILTVDAGAARAHPALVGALVDDAEHVAAEHHRTTLIGGSAAAMRGRVMATTGVGGADPAEPGAAAMLARGYTLQQVYRTSVADLRELDLDQRWADATARAASAGYETVVWSGPTPAEHRPAMRELHERMSTDSPAGELVLEAQTWSDERLAEFETQKSAAGRTMRTAVARQIATGEIVGFTSLFVGATIGVAGGDVARQHDTLVRRDHRGHALGMLLKLANLRELRDHHRTHPRISTMNAVENQHMLAVNDAIGFLPVHHEGVWQRKESA
ncbi:hypothetical protein [Agrococcus sp. Ld7]|uniref:hypothetical protein n=1 Tax=Agrococcus sp. Ld7 TaxID=649148 RepID=UPI003863DAA0